VCIEEGYMGAIISNDMTLEEKLAAIDDAERGEGTGYVN
jgi:hypothetical protein